ncbi:MAG: hypothetical protein LBC75_02860 [Fibromonadaceae bacterium]|jgi:hypothetical protein|nr:hypothetical protein [Fibromonadaceae bacterium]
MKKSCNAVLLILFLALFANAQESLPLPSDSSLAITPIDSSLRVDSLLVTKAIEPIKVEEKKTEETKVSKKYDTYNPEDYQKNLRLVAYLHPLSLFYGAAYNMFMFSSTIEKPLNLSNSVVIQPTIWLGNSDGYIGDAVEYEGLKRFGTGIGIRQYATSKGYGFYLQAMASAYYISASKLQYKEDNDDIWNGYEIKSWTKVKGVVGELMFYVGAAHKWQNISFFYEGGLGFGYDGTETFQMGYINRLAANFNMGVGIPF